MTSDNIEEINNYEWHKCTKKGICDGYCKVSNVKFVVGYIDHNLINNSFFIHKVQHNPCMNSQIEMDKIV
jgi:hypothetical protein